MYLSSDMFDVWLPYWDWECYQCGMWSGEPPRKDTVKKAAEILNSSDQLYTFMIKAIESMPNSAKHNLSKPWLNRAPWLGQSACFIAVGATEEETRLAWCQKMTFEKQVAANNQAKKAMRYWESNYA